MLPSLTHIARNMTATVLYFFLTCIAEIRHISTLEYCYIRITASKMNAALVFGRVLYSLFLLFSDALVAFLSIDICH